MHNTHPMPRFTTPWAETLNRMCTAKVSCEQWSAFWDRFVFDQAPEIEVCENAWNQLSPTVRSLALKALACYGLAALQQHITARAEQLRQGPSH